MLNPQRWGATAANTNGRNGYTNDFEKVGNDTNATLFEIGDEDDESPTFEKGHKRLQCMFLGVRHFCLR